MESLALCYRTNKKDGSRNCCWSKSRVALQLFVVKYVKRCSCCSGSAEFSGNHSSVLRWAQRQRPRLSMLQRNPPAAVSGPATSSTSSRLSSAESPAPPPTMATQDDFAAAKYHTPVAVYCGSIPKFKPRYIALRGGSIDSNLQFCGSKWTTEEEASFQSILTTEMKEKPNLWDGEHPYPRAIPSLDGWMKASLDILSTGDGGDLSHHSHRPLTQQLQEREVSSAARKTVQIKDKLKMRRMSEDLLASHRGLTNGSDPGGVPLKPLVSMSASQRFLATSKPLPPIQNSLPPSELSSMSNGEQEHGENGTGCDDSDGDNKKLTSEAKGAQASLLPLYCNGGDRKKSLGLALIPPIPKTAKPSDEAPGRSAVPPPSSPHLVFQKALEMRPRSGSRIEEKTVKFQELQTLEPILPVLQHRVDGGLKSSGHLCETVLSPLTGPALRQIKEVDHLMNPSLLSDDDLKYSNGRIHVTLSKSVQKKIDEKRMRQMEILRREREKEREKEKSLQLPTQSVDPGDTAKESFGPPPVNGTDFMSPSTSNAHGERAGTALRKRVNGPPLPSIPVISQGDSFPRKSSANSLLANDLDFLECGDTWEARPVPKPQQELLKALTGLSSDDWEQKAKGLFSIRCLAVCHSEVLLSKLHAVSLAVTKEVNNLRSKVSQFAISTLGELFRTMKKHMDHEVDGVAQVLLQRMGDSSKFIQKAADQSLDIMVKSVTAARAMTALTASGVQHCNVLVRRCAAKHLLTAVERIGAEKLLSGARDRTELLVCTVVRFAQDCHPDTRSYGRKMLTVLMSHKNFDTYLKQSVPSRDLIDVMARLKQKGGEDHKCDLPSVKAPRKSRKSSLMTAQQNLPSNESLRSHSDVLSLPHQTIGRTSLRAVEEADQLNELCNLLTAKDFQARREGVVLLLDHCKSSPRFVSTNIFQIFDVFVLRLQDCNKKVNQQALEVLALIIPVLKDALHPVLFSLVSAVIDNLNSKHSGIYAAAVKALEAAIAHLDNRLMLQAFGHRVRFLSGQALLDVTEHLSVLVASLYPSKPQAVKHYALPILWFFLGNRALPVRSSNVRAVVAKLAKTLYQVMGLSLRDHAATQPQHVAKNLWNVLGLNIG
ncbi:LOW QUALITY PROTEIN: TOG array regulator of axonemal microtubules protein 2-like [Strix aluco]|uniref:LOW QUALITY PROTEIN: TOG array regulator of axonemal microtubules protein 2-like n=1 Tax=Strix aluco TaxID=111821 RepID=UPI003DA30EF6